MAEQTKTEKENESKNNGESKQDNFICGVVEGFYGRPWTTEQRKDLFRKLKKWGMETYVYAPKDDYKHRAYWRELYTVEEADHLTGLITAAHEQNINFYYALSPGLDITYSSAKEISTLKRKLDQVSQFGCKAFALLFDDIEPEMSKSDKEVFQSFAWAQVSVTNEIFNHLNCPRFLFCPTQYCSSRAVPTVIQSEYLNTLGSKLLQGIDILWTGPKVISKILTIECIQEITEVLKRPPVIWDNLHANDYDQKRVFLGPYAGRSPELIPLLRGVVTNPNCEFHANAIAIQTLAFWSKCSSDTKVNSSISSDIKLETENEEGICQEDAPAFLSENIYHPRYALKKAIANWLPEFFQVKEAWGPIAKPQPAVTMVLPIIPIIPSVNTGMTLTTTNTTTATSTNLVSDVNTTQLQLFADVCSTVNSVAENLSAPIMNSLVSATKVVTNETLPNPLAATVSTLSIPSKIPISSISVIPILNIKPVNVIQNNKEDEDKIMADENSKIEPLDGDTIIENDLEQKKLDDAEVKFAEEKNQFATNSPGLFNTSEPMECGSNLTSPKHIMKTLFDDINMSETTSTCSGSMQVESSDTSLISNAEMSDEKFDEKDITATDINLLCDLFYLPFEHGGKALQLLTEFYWLKSNAYVLLRSKLKEGDVAPNATEVQEWFRRSETFEKLCQNIFQLSRKIAKCLNQELCYDLFAYVWDVAGVLSLLSAFIKWLALGHFPSNVNAFTQGSYTWFSKGWKEAFMSGDQEPWVFRGGLIVDLQRLIPIEGGNDLFMYKLPERPTLNFYTIRPYRHTDENDVYSICHKTCRDGSDCTELFPENLQGIAADRLVGPFITMRPEYCLVVEDSNSAIVGYICAATDAKIFYRDQGEAWLPEMCLKYPMSLLESPDITQTATELVNHFHNFKYDCPDSVSTSHPSVMTCCLLKEQIEIDENVSKRLVTVLLAALRSSGTSLGVHVCINRTDSFLQQFYSKLGFIEIYENDADSRLYLGRHF